MEKVKLLIIMACCALLLSNCSEKENVEPSPTVPEVNSFHKYIGEKFLVDINLETNQYILKNNDPTILSCKYINDKKRLRITTLKEGETSINIKDINDKVIVIINVSVCCWGSREVEEIAMHPTEKSEILVETADLTIKEQIKNELQKELERIHNTLYTFAPETKVFTMDIGKSGNIFQGEYSWTVDSLILKYNNKIEKYGFQFKGKDTYIIRQDRTKEWQLFYPQANITQVEIKRIWYDWDVIGPIGGLK